MVYKTVEGILYPNGKIDLPVEDLPDRPVRVMVTILGEVENLAEIGDYLDQLADYEEKLARGEIQWS
ncbi:hypothetical protein GG496_000824 [Candidatus Fervidibacteria bacterium JGI MDM2 JNZ-1-D12]